MMILRCFLWTATAMLVLAIVAAARGEELGKPTGRDVPELAAYDTILRELMAKWKVPGGAVAVARDGKLVYARGFGWADVTAKRAVAPDDRFRIASISKPITAVAVLRLVEQGKLSLDDRVVDLLPDLTPPAGAQPKGTPPDGRWQQITVRQLLHHTGGWDRDKSYDPMFRPLEIATALGAPAPADAWTVLRYMRGQPLDFDPGRRFAYSNLGYNLLGRILEARTGRSYAAVVREQVFQPAGITRIELGRTLPKFRPADEVQYYHSEADDFAKPVFPYVAGNVPWPDGGFYLEAMDAHGGWIASPVDLLRFATAVDGRRGKALLQPATLAALAAPPPQITAAKPPQPPEPDAPGKTSPAGNDLKSYYGLGWSIRHTDHGTNWFHTGSLPGTSTLLVRTGNGLAWAVLCNTRPVDQTSFRNEVDAALWKAARETKSWPTHDLFSEFR